MELTFQWDKTDNKQISTLHDILHIHTHATEEKKSDQRDGRKVLGDKTAI